MRSITSARPSFAPPGSGRWRTAARTSCLEQRTIESPTFGAIAHLELATAHLLRGADGDTAAAQASLRVARDFMTTVGIPGWLDRLDLLEGGDLKPWRLVDANVASILD